ncbi:MAG: cupin domain-containing protein [Archaeoglobaceae archaeon]
MKLESLQWEDRGVYKVAKGFELSRDCFTQVVEVKPKKEVGKHYHEKQTEIFVILSGEAIFGIGERVYNARAGDVFICKPKERHWVKNYNNEPFRILVFKYNYVENDIFWE